MSYEDLLQFVFDDYCGYFDKLPDNEFLDEAKNYWEDDLENVISEIKGENQPTMEWDKWTITLKMR